jgi:methionyl-tRNA formyltransferase
VKIAVAASPDVAIPTLEYLLTSEHDLALIISRPDSQVGRGRELTPTAVSNWATNHGIDLYCPNKAVDFDDRLKAIDLVITIGYGVLLPEFILEQPKHGFVNLHFSLLPKLRGAAPAQRAIINGFGWNHRDSVRPGIYREWDGYSKWNFEPDVRGNLYGSGVWQHADV